MLANERNGHAAFCFRALGNFQVLFLNCVTAQCEGSVLAARSLVRYLSPDFECKAPKMFHPRLLLPPRSSVSV